MLISVCGPEGQTTSRPMFGSKKPEGIKVRSMCLDPQGRRRRQQMQIAAVSNNSDPRYRKCFSQTVSLRLFIKHILLMKQSHQRAVFEDLTCTTQLKPRRLGPVPLWVHSPSREDNVRREQILTFLQGDKLLEVGHQLSARRQTLLLVLPLMGFSFLFSRDKRRVDVFRRRSGLLQSDLWLVSFHQM